MLVFDDEDAEYPVNQVGTNVQCVADLDPAGSAFLKLFGKIWIQSLLSDNIYVGGHHIPKNNFNY